MRKLQQWNKMIKRISLWIENIVRRSIVEAIMESEKQEVVKSRIIKTSRNPNQFDHVYPGTEWRNTETNQVFLYKVRWELKTKGRGRPRSIIQPMIKNS